MKKEAQKFLACWAVPTGMGLYEISLQNLIDFGELVEQATLERAAVECENLKWVDGQPIPSNAEFARLVRSLKTKTQD